MQFSSTPDTELQGICYMGCWSKVNVYTFFWGTSRHFSTPGQEGAGEGDRGSWQAHPSYSEGMGVLVEKEQVHKLPGMSFNTSSSPLPRLLFPSYPVCGPQDS